jgi:seryl-tRNA synthetase
LLQRVEAMKNERNTVTKEISQLKRNKENADDKIAAMKKLGDDIDALDKEVKKVEADMLAIQLMIPNMCHPSVPVGKDDSENPEVRKWGQLPEFDFQPLNHWDVGENLGILDSERAAKVTGARFYYYIGAGARLERAVYNFMLDQHTQKDGYTEVIPPYIVNRESMTGTGQLPKFYEDMYRLNVEGEEMYMIPTAEVPLTNYYRGEIIDGAKLPVYFHGPDAVFPCRSRFCRPRYAGPHPPASVP